MPEVTQSINAGEALYERWMALFREESDAEEQRTGVRVFAPVGSDRGYSAITPEEQRAWARLATGDGEHG